jgi:hypothetical protein
MAHDFPLMAQTLGYLGEKEMFETLYGTMSLQELSEALNISTALCRKKLGEHSIPMRKRGGPNGQKIVMTQVIVDEMKNLGSTAVSLKYKVSRYTLFKQKNRFLAEEARKAKVAAAATPSSTETPQSTEPASAGTSVPPVE